MLTYFCPKRLNIMRCVTFQLVKVCLWKIKPHLLKLSLLKFRSCMSMKIIVRSILTAKLILMWHRSVQMLFFIFNFKALASFLTLNNCVIVHQIWKTKQNYKWNYKFVNINIICIVVRIMDTILQDNVLEKVILVYEVANNNNK